MCTAWHVHRTWWGMCTARDGACALHVLWRAPLTRERCGRLKDGLRRAHSSWDRPDGGRALWLTSCRDSECVNELAQLLLSLEGTARSLWA